MVSGGMSFVKYLIFCFNLLFAVAGIAILTIGVVIHFVYAHYSNFVNQSYQWAPIILMVVGVVIFVVAFFGCCGAVKENHCMVITFAILVLIILVLEIAIGVFVYIRRDDEEIMLKTKLNSTMYEYYTNPDIKNTWDIAQHEAECCGMNGPEDWKLISKNNSLPHTCCPDTQDDGTCTINTPGKYTASCFEKLRNFYVKYAIFVGAVGIGIAIFQFIGIIFACCLGRSIRKEYETV